MDATTEVNEIAKGLQAELRSFGKEITDHEAQALSVAGLLAAAECRGPLDPKLAAEGQALILKILADEKKA